MKASKFLLSKSSRRRPTTESGSASAIDRDSSTSSRSFSSLPCSSVGLMIESDGVATLPSSLTRRHSSRETGRTAGSGFCSASRGRRTYTCFGLRSDLADYLARFYQRRASSSPSGSRILTMCDHSAGGSDPSSSRQSRRSRTSNSFQPNALEKGGRKWTG